MVRITSPEIEARKAEAAIFKTALRLLDMPSSDVATIMGLSRATTASWACGQSAIPPSGWEVVAELFDKHRDEVLNDYNRVDKRVKSILSSIGQRSV